MADTILLDVDGNAPATRIGSVNVAVTGVAAGEAQVGLAALITSTGSEGGRTGDLVGTSSPLPVVQTGTPALPTGAATLAEQQSQTTQQTAAAGGIGTAASAAATAGSTGDVNAKLRLVTSQLDAIQTAVGAIQTSVQLLDNAIAGNELQVDIVSGAGSGGTALADRTGTMTPGTTSFTPIGGYVDDTSSDALAEGNPGTVRMTTARAMHQNIAQVAGATVATGNGTAAGAIRVALPTDGTGVIATVSTVTNLSQLGGQAINLGSGAVGAGTVRVTLPTDGTGVIAGITTSVVPGTSATHLGKAVDSPVGATDTGVASLFQRVDSPATLTPVANDYVRGITDSMGRQWAQTGGGMASATLANVTAATSSTSLIASNAARKGFVIINDTTIAGNFLYIHGGGGTASATAWTWRLAPGESVERIGPCITGALTGIWVSAAGGAARTTEFS